MVPEYVSMSFEGVITPCPRACKGETFTGSTPFSYSLLLRLEKGIKAGSSLVFLVFFSYIWLLELWKSSVPTFYPALDTQTQGPRS